MLNGYHIWSKRLGKELMCNLYSITTNQAAIIALLSVSFASAIGAKTQFIGAQ